MEIREHQVTQEPNEDGHVFFCYKIVTKEGEPEVLRGLTVYATFNGREGMDEVREDARERLAWSAALMEKFPVNSMNNDDHKRAASVCSEMARKIWNADFVQKEQAVEAVPEQPAA